MSSKHNYHKPKVRVQFIDFLKNEQACNDYQIIPEYVSQELKDMKMCVQLEYEEAKKYGFA